MSNNNGNNSENNNSVINAEHSAIGSWSGYVYQGLCGIFHTLYLLKTKYNIAKSYKLSLESYEDFSIIDTFSKVVSFHQCKCYKATTDFETECKKMFEKRLNWRNERMCELTTPLLFHSNLKCKLLSGVEQYQINGNVKVGPVFLLDSILDLIKKLGEDNNYPGNSIEKRDRLISLIDKQVEIIHNRAIAEKRNVFDVAKDCPIPFSSFIEILEDNVNDFSEMDKITTSKYYIISYFNEFLDNESDETRKGKIRTFLEALGQVPRSLLPQLIKRLFLHINTAKDYYSLFSKDTIQYLYDVIEDVVQQLDVVNFEFSWNQNETPSTINGRTNNIVQGIINNPNSGEVLRDYRWIVGDIRKSEDDILKVVTKISDFESKSENGEITDKITNPRKVGILTIEDKNNGNYRNTQ